MTARRFAQGSGQGWASLAIAALAAVLVIVGLAIAGGPMQARKERRDQARTDDLARLAAHVECLSQTEQGSILPADLTATTSCPAPERLADDNGAPYRYQPTDALHYRLCADFELPPDPAQARWADKRDGDCILRELPVPPATAARPMDQFEVQPAR